MRIILLLTGFALLCGCSAGKRAAGPRVLQLSIAADEEFRARPGWEKVVRQRVANVSAVWERQFGIRWEVAVVNPWNSDNNAEAEVLRRSLRGATPGPSTLLLGISCQQHSGYSLGFTAPFTKVLVVYDFPQLSEADNAAILCHQFARLFGAWEVPGSDSVMNLRPTTLQFDTQTAEVVRLTKDVDFDAGITGLDTAIAEKIRRMYAAGKGDPAKNPIYLAHARAGEELLGARSTEAALTELRKASEMDPNNARLHGEMAVALMGINELPSAIKEFREVVRLQPLSAAGHANLGSLLARTGNLREGSEEVRKAVALNPGDPSLHFAMGTVLMRTPGQMEAGIAQIREGLRLEPDSAIGKSLLAGAEHVRTGARKP